MVPFNMGSLGFLTPFPPSQMEAIIATIVNGG
jgi:NAD kinase